VIVKEVEIVTVVQSTEELETLKYVVVFFILVVILALAIVLLCFFRSCLKKQTKEELEKIHAKVLQQNSSMGAGDNSGVTPSSRALNENQQYSMKTKGVDDNVIGHLSVKRLGAGADRGSNNTSPRSESSKRSKVSDKNAKTSKTAVNL